MAEQQFANFSGSYKNTVSCELMGHGIYLAAGPSGKNLPRVHDVVRIQRLLDRAHHVHRTVARFLAQKAHLVQAHAVLTGAGAAQGQGALDQLVVQRLGGLALGGAVGIDQVAHVEVAVAHVADQEIRQARGIGFVDRGQDGVGQLADRHTGVGGDGAATGAALDAREIRVVPRRPQARARLGGGGPFKGLAAVVGRDGLHGLRLFFHAGR